MKDLIELVAIGGMFGLLAGLVIGRWSEASIWRGKCGDEVGHRTAMCSGGKFYYVVTEHEYVTRVMPLVPYPPLTNRQEEA